MSSSLPELWSIHRGVAKSVQKYGVFVAMEGYRQQGLVHVSQLSTTRVDDPFDLVSTNEPVIVKVIGFGDDPDNPKISLSMKVVNQRTGEDLDKNNVRISLDLKKGKALPDEIKRLRDEDCVMNAICRKCGCKGHIALNCFGGSGGTKYELLAEDDVIDHTSLDPDIAAEKERKRSHKSTHNKGEKEHGKSRKHKKHRHSRHDNSSDSDGNRERVGDRKKERERVGDMKRERERDREKERERERNRDKERERERDRDDDSRRKKR